MNVHHIQSPSAKCWQMKDKNEAQSVFKEVAISNVCVWGGVYKYLGMWRVIWDKCK